MALPALRPVEAHPIEHEGEQYVCLSDPTGFVDERLLLTPAAFFIAAQLTGLADEEDIQETFRQQFEGHEILVDRIREVVDHLDQAGLLFTESFAGRQREVEESFRAAPVREAHLAGKSYPADPDELRAFLDEQFEREDGPGEGLGPQPGSGPPLRGLIVPHIDFHRGGHSYARGYLSMYNSGRPDTVFIFGVAHMAQPSPFILTRKAFETPLGTLETDGEFIDRIEAACGWDLYEHELTHRTEHSIEFQAVMLAHLFGPEVRIVPILCSMFSDEPGFDDPGSLEPVETFLAACRKCVESDGKAVSVIAAVDLAHVGKRFGDAFDIDDSIVEEVARRDREDLKLVHSIKPVDFYSSVMKDTNQRRVCGINSLYATLKVLEGVAKKGKSLHYDYAHDPSGGIVSFTSVSLT